MTYDEAMKALSGLGSDYVARESEDGEWEIVQLTASEIEAEREMVTVTFQTRADLLADELTDADWITLGKSVADMANAVRVA